MKKILTVLVCMAILSTFTLVAFAQEFELLNGYSIYTDSCHLEHRCPDFSNNIVDGYGNFYVDTDRNSASISCDTLESHIAAAGVYGCDIYGNYQYDPTDGSMNEAFEYAYASITFSNTLDYVYAGVAVFCEHGQESWSFSY